MAGDYDYEQDYDYYIGSGHGRVREGKKVEEEKRVARVVLSKMAAGIPALLARIEQGTGRLLNPDGKFAIFDQHPIYALAFLYRAAGTEWQGRKELLEAARGMGGAILDLQAPDGRFPLIKDDGSHWGHSTLPWHVGPWLEAWRLLGEDLDAGTRERWREGLARWMESVAGELSRKPRLHNIQAYCAAILVRAARLMARPEWERIGERFLRKIAKLQTEDGYWPEGGSPTLIYNLVYLHALGLYHLATGAAWVRRHLQRGLALHLIFTYPDGTCVETVDGRVRHHREPFALGLLAFLPFPEGQELAARILERISAAAEEGVINGNLAYALENWPEEENAPPAAERARIRARQRSPFQRKTLWDVLQEGNWTWDAPGVAVALAGRALARRGGDWFWCLSGLGRSIHEPGPSFGHRWHNDLGQRLSLWHARAGLVIGGGSSRLDPAFHTFAVVTDGAFHFAPDFARVEAGDDRGDALRLTCGFVRCRLDVGALEDGAVSLRWSAEWPDRDNQVAVTAGFTLPGLLDREARSSLKGTQPETLGARKDVIWIERPDPPVPEWTLAAGKVEIGLPVGATFHWPEYPFNPYAIDNAAPPEEAVGAVSFRLENGEEKEVTVRIRG